MSPSNINSFVGDLVQMAQAMEELPKAQDRIAELTRQLDEAQRHNQGLEQNILGYKDQITHWQDVAKALTDQRDNAELRCLELEDRNNAVSRFLGTFMSDANALRNVIDPPKPEPVPETGNTTQSHSETNSGTGMEGQSADVVGQSASDPSVQHPDAPPNVSSSHATSGDVGSTTTEHSGDSHSEISANPEPSWAEPTKPIEASPPKPYANMNYKDYPSWVSRQDWIAGGGTNDTYDFRKSRGF